LNGEVNELGAYAINSIALDCSAGFIVNILFLFFGSFGWLGGKHFDSLFDCMGSGGGHPD